MTKIIQTVEEAKQDKAYVEALTELLYQLGDDDFIISYRGSEWLGIAPHIEEDVAYSSITQNTMGHAAMFYQMLEDLGEGAADDLAHARKPAERRNGIYLEKANGEGDFVEDPQYDWALAVVRNFLYEMMKRVKLEAATESSYEPLRQAAHKVLMEQSYHLAHWRLWVEQLQDATEEAQEKIKTRLDEAWKEFGDTLEYGPKADDMVKFGLITDEKTLQERWLERVNEVLSNTYDALPANALGNGRAGEYTKDLEEAFSIFSEVYMSDPQASW